MMDHSKEPHPITVYQKILTGVFSDGTPITQTQTVVIPSCLIFPTDQTEFAGNLYRLCVPSNCEFVLDGSQVDTICGSFYVYDILTAGGYDDSLPIYWHQYLAESLAL